jgi:hypothetical protein
LIHSVTKSEVKRSEKTFISSRFEVKGKIGRETIRKETLLEVKQSEKTLISLRFEGKRIIRREKVIKLCFNFAVVGSKNLKRNILHEPAKRMQNGSGFALKQKIFWRNQRTLNYRTVANFVGPFQNT